MTDTWRTLPEGAAAGLSGNVRGADGEKATTRAEGSVEAQKRAQSLASEGQRLIDAWEDDCANRRNAEPATRRLSGWLWNNRRELVGVQDALAEVDRLRISGMEANTGDLWFKAAHAALERAERAEAELAAASTRFATALDEQAARLDQARKERRDALAKVARVEALCDANAPSFNPGRRDAHEMVEFERDNPRYVEGWDDAVDNLQQAVMRALAGDS